MGDSSPGGEGRFQGYSRISVLLKKLLLLRLPFAPSVACSDPQQLPEHASKTGLKWMVERFKLSFFVVMTV